MNKLNIYVASSWRNSKQQEIVKLLRDFGNIVYDFKNNLSFHWSEIDTNYKEWEGKDFIASLTHPLAIRAFDSDMQALINCDCCVLVLPCGKSAHLEAGYAVGAKKKLIILLEDKNEPELTYKMADYICTNIPELLHTLNEVRRELNDKGI
jgi:nucleoside 2-deoxyribosyltransferase